MKRCKSRLASCGGTAGVFSWLDDNMENEVHLVSPVQLLTLGASGKESKYYRVTEHVRMYSECVCVRSEEIMVCVH